MKNIKVENLIISKKYTTEKGINNILYLNFIAKDYDKKTNSIKGEYNILYKDLEINFYGEYKLGDDIKINAFKFLKEERKVFKTFEKWTKENEKIYNILNKIA